ncbi:agmatine deiminase [Syntrophobotulus glycolicus DSM 8271]|uniref:Agmatine deiminase n=1 Tax=Syntrophobotulus glycolicus (strain DSM 8271 / FlGlyR) TaxID=645991 RepID=F0T020_SYNGF|nr:agmatine deiminase family protein [Syntrophobotulus glycolicus]ADY55031.1 agmatine deiminase [Syntrophobotulus glycolicus DSM 8271]
MYPKDLNYRMPPEWDGHAQTLISWPVRESMCYPEDYASVCQAYAEIIRAIAEFEPVTVMVNSPDLSTFSSLFQEGRIQYLPIEHNDAWLRDNGPTFLVSDQGDVAGVNWQFNAWGGKYSPWDLDNQAAPAILDHFALKQFDSPLILEGGSIHVDGEGTVLTTEECLLNPNRNRGLTREQIEDQLKKYLNIRKVIWLKSGLSGDETDGHVDNVACFAAPGKILLQVCDDPEDENYAITRENLKVLTGATDARDRKLDIIPVQQPPKMSDRGRRLTLSYLNFYFVNGGLILPVFGGQAEKSDHSAIRVLGELFPERQLRTVNGMGLIREGGNVHCITQQLPSGKKEK